MILQVLPSYIGSTDNIALVYLLIRPPFRELGLLCVFEPLYNLEPSCRNIKLTRWMKKATLLGLTLNMGKPNCGWVV